MGRGLFINQQNINSDLLILPNKVLLIDLEVNLKPRTTRSWGRDCKTLYQNRCLISGECIQGKGLVAHHMYSRSSYKSLEFSLLNGICLSDTWHKKLHKACGLQTAPPQFIQYIRVLGKESIVMSQLKSLEIIEWVTFLENQIQIFYPDK